MTKYLPTHAQRGVSAKPREHLILTALDLPSDGAAARATVEALRGIVREELTRMLADPNAETGELGFTRPTTDYNLEVTLGISSGGYDKLDPSKASPRPIDLAPMPADVLDTSGNNEGAVTPGEGDLLLHIASDDVYVVEHVVHRIEAELGGQISPRWLYTGNQRYRETQLAAPSRQEARALIGFLDGTNNLTMSEADQRALVFTDHTTPIPYPQIPTGPASPYQNPEQVFPPSLALRNPPTGNESPELDGGSYMALEVIVTKTPDFDSIGRAQQEVTIGRDKATGAKLASPDVHSHIKKANPHSSSEDENRRFLRRGYPLVQSEGGKLQRGLIFLAFGRSLSTQVEFVQRGWINNPNFPDPANPGTDKFLNTFVEPRLLAGGYYFVPPLRKATDPTSWATPES